MSAEVKMDIDDAYRQASLTAADYLDRAYEILDKGINDYTVSDAIALAHIMAIDFNYSVDYIKTQEIRDELNGVSISLENIATALCKLAQAMQALMQERNEQSK